MHARTRARTHTHTHSHTHTHTLTHTCTHTHTHTRTHTHTHTHNLLLSIDWQTELAGKHSLVDHGHQVVLEAKDPVVHICAQTHNAHLHTYQHRSVLYRPSSVSSCFLMFILYSFWASLSFARTSVHVVFLSSDWRKGEMERER